MLVAADNTHKVHPQGIQRAGVLCCVQLVGNLFNTEYVLQQLDLRVDFKGKQREEEQAPVCSRSG